MDNSQLLETFREEAHELLGSLEAQLLNLEQNPTNPDVLSAVFRVMHTIKGSAGMFGLDDISRFAHEVESILSALRDGSIPYCKEIIDYTLEARDYIYVLLESSEHEKKQVMEEGRKFLKTFRNAVGFTASTNISGAAVHTEKKANVSGQLVTWHIIFKPSADLLKNGTNPLLILSELRSLGELAVIADLDGIPAFRELDPTCCYTRWELFLTTDRSIDAIRDVFIFIEGLCELDIKLVSETAEVGDGQQKKLGTILIENGKLDQKALDQALKSQKRLGEVLVEQNIVSQTDLAVALEEQKIIQKSNKEKSTGLDFNTIRVKSEKLDELMNLVGELVTVHARIQETAKHNDYFEDISSVVELFGRLTNDLRNNTMSIRMVPVGGSFVSFKRLVRDLSGELGKKIDLETIGGETELDKSVIEKLHDPLVHLIRNSIDHGIELPDLRRERGKNETGIIRLEATQSGASVYITIEDDGNGLDRDKIITKAVEKGLVKIDQVISDEDVYRLIFLPGFSTKEKVSAVSGRGVGMDVVNRQMELIGGSIEVQSTLYQGTKILLKIPLTLAIIDGLLVRISDEHYLIPLSAVEGCLEFVQTPNSKSNYLLIYHEQQMPYIDLRNFFDIPGNRPEIQHIVIVRIKNKQYGLLVDHILGDNQTVIKPLGSMYKQAKGISSATIRGDGSIALILDVEQIIQQQ